MFVQKLDSVIFGKSKPLASRSVTLFPGKGMKSDLGNEVGRSTATTLYCEIFPFFLLFAIEMEALLTHC